MFVCFLCRPSIGDFVAIVGPSRPAPLQARSNLNLSIHSSSTYSSFSLDFEDEGLLTPTSLLRNKNKASLSRQDFECLLSLSHSPDSAEDVRLPETAPTSSTSDDDLFIFKIPEDAEEKLVIPPGAEEKAGYNIPDEPLSSDSDEKDSVASPRTMTAVTIIAEEKSDLNKVKLPSLALNREEKSSSSVPYRIQAANASDRKQARGSPPLVLLPTSDNKSPQKKGSPPVLLNKKPSPPGSKVLPDIAAPRLQEAPSRSPSLLLTERSLTPEPGGSDCNVVRRSISAATGMRRSQSHHHSK